MFIKLRNFILYTFVSVIILIAVSLSAVRILLPDVQSYRTYIEEELAVVLERPVKIGNMDALVSGVTPIVRFYDVRLMSNNSDRKLLEIKKIEIGFSIWNSVKQRKFVPSIYTIDGVELAIIRKKDGKILIQDFDVSGLSNMLSDTNLPDNNELSQWLFNRSSLVIQNSSIIWHDKKRLTKPTHFKDVTLKLKNNGNRHQFNGEFILSKNKNKPKALEIAMDLYGDMLDPIKWVGEFYAKGLNVDVSEWSIKPVIMDVMIDKGRLDFEIWGDWIAGELNQVEANINAHSVVIKKLKNNAISNVKLLSGLVHWKKESNNWDLSIDDLMFTTEKGSWPVTQLNVTRRVNDVNQSESTVSNIKYFRIEDVSDLILKSGYAENKILKYLQHASPAGELVDVQYEVLKKKNKSDEFFFSAKVKGLSLTAYEDMPGLKNVTGDIFSSHNSGSLAIKSKNAELDFQTILEKPVLLDNLTGNIDWIKRDDSWIFSSKEIAADNKDASLIVSFKLDVPKNNISPYLDLQSKIIKGNAVVVKNFLPKVLMVGDFKKWMDSAFISGEISSGGIVVNGRIDEFPYSKNNGTFEAHLIGENIALNYKQNWPYMHDAELEAVFTGSTMNVDVKNVRLNKSRASNFTLRIDDFNKPLVKTKVYIKSNLDDVAQYATTTFLKDSRDFVVSSQFSGEVNIDLFLSIPLSDKVEKLYPINLKAKAELVNANVITVNGKLDVSNINGVVNLTKKSVTANDVKAKILGGDTVIDVFTQSSYGGNPIRFVMRGNVDVSKGMQRFGLSGYDKISGKTDWQGVFTLPHVADGVAINPILQVSADMRDVIIDLPPPVTKKMKVNIPSYLTIENISKENMLVHFIFGEEISFAMDIDTSKKNNSRLRRGEFRFKSEAAEIPKDEVLLVTGSLNDFSLRDWLDSLEATSVKRKERFFGIPMKIDMDSFHIAKPKNKNKRKPSDPRLLPTFEGVIRNFKYDVYPFGTFKFKTVNEKMGMRLEKFTLSSPTVSAQGKGYWYYRRNKQVTEVTMTLNSEDYGGFLSSLGFASIIDNGVAEFSGDFNWKGGFGDFEWATVNGVVTADIKNGVFKKVDPGAGRLLGLLSIESLPSMLFTGSAFNEGINFDRIIGNYELFDGSAYSDNVNFIGPAANILITGRTGIVARDFDQYLTVVPNVSGALPLTSGFVFGPQVGAVVYFFKNLFGSGIDESSKRFYHITGSWDKPVTTRVDKDGNKIEEQQAPEKTEDDFDEDN